MSCDAIDSCAASWSDRWTLHMTLTLLEPQSWSRSCRRCCHCDCVQWVQEQYDPDSDSDLDSGSGSVSGVLAAVAVVVIVVRASDEQFGAGAGSVNVAGCWSVTGSGILGAFGRGQRRGCCGCVSCRHSAVAGRTWDCWYVESPGRRR